MSKIIHCNHNSSYNKSLKRRSYKGSTWIFTAVDSTNIKVQYAICSRKDSYDKKKGRTYASESQGTVIPKLELPNYVYQTAHRYHGTTRVPNSAQLLNILTRMN